MGINFLYLDCETTGLYPDKHDIIQLACIPIIDGVAQTPFNEFCQPINWTDIEQGAIDVHGITVDRMKSFQKPKEMLDKLISYLSTFKTKFVIAGFNVDFDRRFLVAFFTKHEKAIQFFSNFEIETHDAYKRAQKVKDQLKTPNLKLETLAKHFKIPIKAHDALSDISATIDVDRRLGEMLGEDRYSPTSDISIKIQPNTQFKEPAQLHLHSMYGMVESVPSIEEWMNWCKSTGTPGFSIVDHGPATSLYDIVRLKDKSIVGVPGVGFFLSVDRMAKSKRYPINAWAINNTGYYNLMHLSSLAYEKTIEDDGIIYPLILMEDVLKYNEGLQFGIADIYGPIGEAILKGDKEAAKKHFNFYMPLKDKLFVEFNPVSISCVYTPKSGYQNIKRNASIPDGDWGKAYNLFLADMVDRYKLPCLPVCGAHFIEPADKLIQVCISRNSYKSEKSYIESYHAKTVNTLYSELKYQLEDWLTEEKFSKWIDNSHHIMEQAKSIEIKNSYHLPKIEIPDHIKQKTSDYNEQTKLYARELCQKHNRWSNDPEYVERYNKEIDVIANNPVMNFLPYFLLYEDISTYARSIGVMQNIGRGSAGGCLLSYYLKIIHIDPIKTKLPFERFLSNARIRAGSFPDIDSDFGDRSKIITYLSDKYKSGFAQICTIQTMKTKNAIKDAMGALYGKNRGDPTVKMICDLIPDSPQGVAEFDFLYGYDNSEGEPQKGLIEIMPELASFFNQYKQVEDLVKRLIGLPRSVGRHASAYVVSTLDLSSERVPTRKILDKKSGKLINVTQYEASMIEKCGLVKADILGVTTINAVSECINLIKERTGKDYLQEDENGVAAIYRLPESKAVYTDFYNKKTDSSFQFNSSVIKRVVKDFAPESREHLSIMTALMRPGSMDAMMDVDVVEKNRKTTKRTSEHNSSQISASNFYISVRQGNNEPYFLHEDLRPILEETYGVIVFQEQVMSILVEICGYTLEETDTIRSAIAKKKHDVIMSTFARIREACANRGWDPHAADKLCNQIMAFSRYSFNRSHSRCISADQGIITKNGIKPMCKITIEDEVLSTDDDLSARYIKPDDVWQSGYKDVYEIKLEDGSIIYMTEDHKVRTMSGWIEVKDAMESQIPLLIVEKK